VWPGQARANAIPELLSAAAAVGPGAGGVRFVPHMEGRIVPYEPELRGGFHGLGSGHGHGHLARAVLESIALEYGLYLEAMRRLDPGAGAGEVLAIGGGSRSALWNAIKADVLGIPVRRVELDETATRGVAVLAGGAVGALDAPDVAAGVALGPSVEPDPGRHAIYRESLHAHRRVLAAFSELSTLGPRPQAAALV
jgi:xylulokinase